MAVRRSPGSVRRALAAALLAVVVTAFVAGAAPAVEAQPSPQPPPSAAPGGYWLVGRDGGVFAFGDAPFAGSAAGVSAHPVVGIAPTQSGDGYWLAASDGGVFTFGDARYLGSAPAHPGLLNGEVVAFASATLFGDGYYLVTDAGGIYTFGAAPHFGAPASGPVPHPIVDFAVTPSGHGYWALDASGTVYAYGDAPALTVPRVDPTAPGADVRVALQPWSGQAVHVLSRGGGVFTGAVSPNHAFFYGASPDTGRPMADMASCRCSGYHLVDVDGTVHPHGDARSFGSIRDVVPRGRLNGPIVAMQPSQPAG